MGRTGTLSPPAPSSTTTAHGPRRSDAFYSFHTINAWEQGGSVHIDLIAYEDAYWVDAWRLPHLRSGQAAPPSSDIRR